MELHNACKIKANEPCTNGSKRALYLFAGEKRHSSVADYLINLGWKIDEIDILRTRKHDLTKKAFSQKLLDKIKSNCYTAVLGSPPCDTYSRVKFANRNGPRPSRTAAWRRGFPWLKGNSKRLVQLANTLTDFTWSAAKLQAKLVPGLLLLEFPEDLGAVSHGSMQGVIPASFWQYEDLNEVLKLENTTTVAVHQADYGAPYLKPTRLLFKGVPSSTGKFFRGLPRFDNLGYYTGPLPRRNASQEGLKTLARRSTDKGFRTSGTAAWPPKLCEWIAKSLDESVIFCSIESGDQVALATEEKFQGREEDREDFPITAAVPDHWIGGIGPPRTTYALGKYFNYNDGAGLTSPGRWDKHCRVFPQGKCWDQLREKMLSVLINAKLPDGSTVGSSGIQKILLQLACTPKTDVFRTEWVLEGRSVLRQWIAGRCGDFDQSVVDIEPGQPFCLYLLHFLLREMKDADYVLFDTLRQGVTAGILSPLPRTPALYEEQVRWRLCEDPLCHGIREAENYSSLADHLEEVEEQFRQEEKEGFMIEMEDAAVKEKYGDRFAISPLAVLVEGPGKIRVIHDGTHKTRINHRIRCRDKLRSPGVREKHLQLRQNRQNGVIPISILADFSKAHRLVKILEQEWGMLGCKLRPGTTWLNRVGTFGVGSAAYWWSRLSGGLMRFVYGICGKEWSFEALLFADDLDFEAESEKERIAVVFALFLLIVVGAPMKAAKFRGGFRVQWIGLFFDNKSYSLGLSPARAGWLVNWIRDKLKEGRVHVREMAGGLGRINFAATALYHERAWLGPIYSWTSAVLRANKAVVDIPWGIRLFLHWIARRLESGGELMTAPEIPKEDGDWFRSDAKAEGGRATIGAWETKGGKPAKECRWFYLELLKEEADWVFSKENDPGRVIAALELLGTLLSLILFDIRADSLRSGGCSVTGMTDNLGNSFAVSKGMSTKFPLAPLLIELNEQLRCRNLDLRLTWVRRDSNVEADAITNQDFSVFDESKRIHVSYPEIKWLVLGEVMKASKEIFDQVTLQRQENNAKRNSEAKGSKPLPSSGGKFKSLKRTAPW